MLETALSRPDLAAVWRADLLLASSRAALLQEQWETAASRANEAEETFRAHRRPRWAARSTLLGLEAAYAAEQEARRSTDGISARPRPSLPEPAPARPRARTRPAPPRGPGSARGAPAPRAGGRGHRSRAGPVAGARRRSGATA